MKLHLMSHALCPYVQRAAISLSEKKVPFERTDIDLANKPDWFLDISPLGKTPVLSVEGQSIFESSAILEYLEDTQPNPLHPSDPVERARHRGWIEFGSSTLNDIGGFYSARHAKTLDQKTQSIKQKFARLEGELGAGPYFAGDRFSLVDAVFGPVFRYFDTFDRIMDFGFFADKPKLEKWRSALAERPSIAGAVSEAYPDLLWAFLAKRNSFLSEIIHEHV